MRLFGVKKIESDTLVAAPPIVLVVEETPEAALRAFSTAVPAAQVIGHAVLTDRWEVEDLGPHAGPETAGSVFMDGIRIGKPSYSA
ncbi:hypothetical protein [Mongoliimonas terrestris]|uniref:hypothetical protein n=1 Tax=Mongoliimonas terrestris TaxID=1709001 RepID=UPI0009494F37|nr:hypothetical protein [Mongoliimonas terrestris]